MKEKQQGSRRGSSVCLSVAPAIIFASCTSLPAGSDDDDASATLRNVKWKTNKPTQKKGKKPDLHEKRAATLLLWGVLMDGGWFQEQPTTDHLEEEFEHTEIHLNSVPIDLSLSLSRARARGSMLGFNLSGFAPTSRWNTTTTVLKGKKKSICMNVCIPGECWQQAGRS